jgi:light-independent protochlorophyllide reductase subunit N
LGISRVSFLPHAQIDRPARGCRPNTRVILAQPYLGEAAKSTCRGARAQPILTAPFPLGEEGTTGLAQGHCRCIRRGWGTLRRHHGRPAGGARARQWRRSAPSWREGVCSCFPIPQIEPSIARFLYRETGADSGRDRLALPASAPYGTDLALIADGPVISEGQDVDLQLDRVRAARPDLTVCGLGLANPLEAEGLATKWAIELVFTPVHGYEQAGDLAALFARPLERRARIGLSGALRTPASGGIEPPSAAPARAQAGHRSGIWQGAAE